MPGADVGHRPPPHPSPSPTTPSFPRRRESTKPPSLQRKGARVSGAKRAGDARGGARHPERMPGPPRRATLPLSSPTKGARASEASTRGMPGGGAETGTPTYNYHQMKGRLTWTHVKSY